jgi:hypothetical protein
VQNRFKGGLPFHLGMMEVFDFVALGSCVGNSHNGSNYNQTDCNDSIKLFHGLLMLNKIG